MCQYGKIAGCQAVVEKCKGSDKYSQQDCDNLSIVCDAIESGIIPDFKTPSEPEQPSTSVVSNPTNPLTPSGVEVPDSLMIFLDCPIGDVLCKSGKGSSCMMHTNVCRYTEPENLAEELNNNGWEIGNLSTEQFCSAFYEVCDMISSYDPPLTDNDVYNYEKYFVCNVDDSMCQYGKIAGCQAVVEKCKGSDKYSQQDCDNLSIVCDAIESGIVPDFKTPSEPEQPSTSVVSNPTNPLTPSGVEVPDSLMIFLDCPIGDVLCKSGKGSSCMMHTNVCRYTEPENLAEELNNNDDSMCQYGKIAGCQAVVEKCKGSDKYSQQDCDNLSIVCDAIESGIVPDFKTPSEPEQPSTSVVSNPTNPLTPSGVEVPDSLMIFLDCPIGDVLCKSGKGSSCMMHTNVCRYTEPENLAEELNNNGWEIGKLSTEQFCSAFYEVCDMINNYESPLTDNDVYNYEKYFVCNVDDTMCQYGKITNCQAVVEKCKGSDKYSQQDCDNLSIVCDAIESGIIPNFEETTTIPITSYIPTPTTTSIKTINKKTKTTKTKTTKCQKETVTITTTKFKTTTKFTTSTKIKITTKTKTIVKNTTLYKYKTKTKTVYRH
ncbi:hypothetical protein PIROE2DRAFT_10813 [Piromyces sp. E2]|nr:hypothetical protein PIROE2DRAFT_10813 [Piromyces sp. E2]|eukprot:OUM62780.1 hypothetical protein PIROE2DRAFT_10813 [Piromyces sp. E2]